MKKSLLVALALLTAISITADAKKKKKRDMLPALRFPFGLVPGMKLDEVKKSLDEKGLAYLREKDVAGELVVRWGMDGQIAYGKFKPKEAVAIFNDGKIASLAFLVSRIPECAPAQVVFLSALDFARQNYDPKESPVTEEPAVDTLDCGPAFKSETYKLRVENKKIVLMVIPLLKPEGYEITVTYYDRPAMKSTSQEPTTEDQQNIKATQQNL